MILYGTVTSPYVRRVRIVALELGLAFELRDANVDAIQAELRAIAPAWKIPTVQFGDSTVLWDSSLINDELVRRHGFIPALDTEGKQRLAVLDAALDAAISLFYMRRDGVDLSAPYLRKQRERMDAAMDWITAELEAGRFGGALTLDTIAVVAALDWFDLRKTWPVEAASLKALSAQWNVRPSFASTLPG